MCWNVPVGQRLGCFLSLLVTHSNPKSEAVSVCRAKDYFPLFFRKPRSLFHTWFFYPHPGFFYTRCARAYQKQLRFAPQKVGLRQAVSSLLGNQHLRLPHACRQVSRHFPARTTDLLTKTQLPACLQKLSNEEGWSHAGNTSLRAPPCSVRPALLQISSTLKELEVIQQQTPFGLITTRESSPLTAYTEGPGSSASPLHL